MDNYIVGIGAANIDIHCQPKAEVIMRDSNPSHMHLSLGGVTRNICENFIKLGGNVKLISAIGNDHYGTIIRDDCRQKGIDISESMNVEGSSSTYISCLDNHGDMFVAFSDMSVLQNITMEFIDSKAELLNHAKLIVCDPALSVEVLDGLTSRYGTSVPIFCDPVSIAYAHRLKPFVGRMHTIKPNRMELGELSDHAVETDEDLYVAAKKLINLGTKRVIVSLGERGCFYLDSEGTCFERGLKPLKEMVNATGGGDAFMAANIYGYTQGLSLDDTIDYALAAGMAAVSSADTINPNMSVELLKSIIKEKKI